MNKRSLKRALRHYANGKQIRDICQYVDVEKRDLMRQFSELGVDSANDARKALAELESDLSPEADATQKTNNENAGQVVPEHKAELTEYKGKFDRQAAVLRDGQQKVDKVPLATQSEFREDLKVRPWVQIVRKWGDKLSLSEDALMEQAVLLAPGVTRERFGFGSVDNNLEGKNLPQ